MSAMQPCFQGTWKICCWVWWFTTSAALKRFCHRPSLSYIGANKSGVFQVVWVFHFTEAPVKVQISCNLEPCCLNKLITAPPTCMRKPFPGQETGNLFADYFIVATAPARTAILTWSKPEASYWNHELNFCLVSVFTHIALKRFDNLQALQAIKSVWRPGNNWGFNA